MAVGEFRLRDESLVDPIETEQAGQQVVAGQECVVAGGGQ